MREILEINYALVESPHFAWSHRACFTLLCIIPHRTALLNYWL